LLDKKIEEILFLRKHIPVKIRINTELTPETAKELEITKSFKGSEIEIPWWKARILLEEGLAELLEKTEIDKTYMQKKIWSEKSKTQLDDIDGTFYIKIAQKLSKLKEENKKNPNPILIQKIENLETPLNDLLSSRITKILKMSYRGATAQNLEKLTLEEKWLYQAINEIIKTWMQKILGD
jgi:hypothetical protein